ncbi:MAG: hypothetical protein IPK13_27865 [Deltaproteobacteria bacterium]|nr:hypothetical protein [Deltaproteobacteria bacterium]
MTALTTPMTPFTYDLQPEPEFAVLDTETTGVLPSVDRIVEISVVRIQRTTEPVLCFDSLVNPERDVGPTNIHGISASMVARAPRFEDIAGAVAEALSGAIIVGHNVAFDLRFLRREYDRLGITLPEVKAVCTLGLSRRILRKTAGHRLSWLCERLGIPHIEAHRASSDAFATSRLLVALLERAKAEPITRLEVQAYLRDAELLDALANELSHGRRVMRREDSDEWMKRGGEAFLQRLVRRIPSPALRSTEEEAEPNIELYLSMLDLMLEDRFLDDEEQDRLVKAASEWKLSEDVVRRAHARYLEWLVDTALEDRTITAADRADLQQVSHVLGIAGSAPTDGSSSASAIALDALIEARTKQVADGALPSHKITDRDAHRRRAFVDKSVCFTGTFFGPRGEGCSRAEAEEMAVRAGLRVAKSVTRKLDLLVVADPMTQSGKAKKARKYGITILAEHVFWRALGLT